MTTAEVYREGGKSVELPLVDSSSGTPLFSTDIGKPNLEIQQTGSIDPRHIDQFSGLESYTLLGRFTSSDAYKRARTLCDLLKENSNGNPLYLDVDLPEFDGPNMVAPAAGQEESVSVVYKPGRRDWVEVDLGLTRVSETQGGSDQPAQTPTSSGRGPIQIRYRGESVSLSNDIEVERAVGRPKSVVRKDTDGQHPRYIDKHKTAHDAFELSLDFNQNTVQQVNKLVGLFRRQLNRNPLLLDFQGLYGLGAFPVVPQGSGALRHTRPSGEQGTTLIPKISLRRVLSR